MVDEATAAGIGRVWTDQAFRRRLMESPRQALAEIGIPVAEGAAVRIVGSKGAPGDADDPSLIQVVMEQDGGYAYFFVPSPRSPCAQQAAYGLILTRSVDDAALGRRVLLDAARASRSLAAQRQGLAEAAP